MLPDTRSISFTFKSNQVGNHSNDQENTNPTRQCLERQFDEENESSHQKPVAPAAKNWRRNFSLSNISVNSQQTGRRVLRTGGEKLTRTISNMRISLDELSQKLRRSTRRRQRLSSETSISPKTPGTQTRHLLGRTPTKMYSPFSIDTPRQRRTTPSRAAKCLGKVYSPHMRFPSDVADARNGIADLDKAAQNIVRKCLRN